MLIVSSLAEEGAEETVAALALGAADTLPKPGTGRFNGRFSEVLLGKLRALGRADDQRARADPEPRSRVAASPLRGDGRRDPLGLLAIGASTGGIHALATPVRGAAAADRRADPRHPASARAVHGRASPASSATASGRAGDGRRGRHARCSPDQIVIAPGDAHLNVDRAGDRLIVRLSNQQAWRRGCLPSVDPMLSTAAARARRRARSASC